MQFMLIRGRVGLFTVTSVVRTMRVHLRDFAHREIDRLSPNNNLLIWKDTLTGVLGLCQIG